MAFAAVGFLAEALAVATETIGSTIAFATGSELAGTVAGGAFKGAVIGAATDAAKSGATGVIGQENVSDFKETLNTVADYNFNRSNHQGGFGQQSGRAPDASEYYNNTNNNTSRQGNEDRVKINVPSGKNPTLLNSQQRNPSVTESMPIDDRAIIRPEPVVNDSAQRNISSSGNYHDAFQKMMSKRITTASKEDSKMSPSLDKSKNVGSDLGNLIGLQTAEIFENNMNAMDAMNSVINRNPALEYLVKPVLEYQQDKLSKPSLGDQYAQISAVYNGRSLNTNDVTFVIDPSTGLKVFSAKDEVGKVWRYRENKNHVVVKPIWGVWTGMNSPNNNLPVSLLDRFAYEHDCAYHENMFDQVADYKLVSRIYNNWDRLTSQEKPAALVAMKYFSTIGQSVAQYKGTYDAFSKSGGGLKFQGNSQKSKDNSFFDKLIQDGILDSMTMSLDVVESEFNKSLDESLEETLSTSSSIGGNQSMINLQRLQYAIDNLEIELL